MGTTQDSSSARARYAEARVANPCAAGLYQRDLDRDIPRPAGAPPSPDDDLPQIAAPAHRGLLHPDTP